MSLDSVEVIEMVARRLLAHRFAPMWCEVVQVGAADATRQTADIRPLNFIPRVDRDTMEIDYIEGPVIPNVIVALPASSASDETLKLAEGDFGLYVPLMFSMDELVNADVRGPVRQADPRQQDYMDGIFLPFRANRAVSAGAVSADRAILGTDVRVGNPDAAQSLAFTSNVQARFDALEAQLTAEFAKIAVILNTAGPVVGVPGQYPPPVISAGTVGGTNHLKGS